MSEENKKLTPIWIAHVDGKRLDTEHEGALIRIVVSDCLNGIGSCTFTFDDSAVELLDKKVLQAGSNVTLQLGYKDDCGDVFKGQISAIRVQREEYGHKQLVVTCKNALYQLRHGRHMRSFSEKNASDIIGDIIDTYGLKSEIDTFGATNRFTAESGIDDYRFILELAHTYGKDVYAYGDTIYVKDTIAVHNDEIVYEEGKSLSRFSLEENIESVIAKADYVGWDMLKGESFNGSVSVSDVSMTVGGESAWNETVSVGNNWISFFADDGLVDAEDAKARAAAEVQNKSFGFITGTGSGEGNYKLLPGMHLTIKYVGAPFEGEYIADSVMHSFDYTNGYTTSFSVKRNMTS
ncbi:MAG: phage late control D family protein [Treponema socranskii subsp. buccale]|jgi:hypothetical protein